MPREGSAHEARWFDVDPCFAFHILNAYDDAGHVVLDLCRYDRAFDVATLSGPGPVTLARWIIDPGVGKTTTSVLDDRHQEFPRIDDRRVGQFNRYGYAAVIGEGIAATISVELGVTGRRLGNALLKHDLTTGTTKTHQFGADEIVGEVVFVPATTDADSVRGSNSWQPHSQVAKRERGNASSRVFTGGSQRAR